MLSVQHLSVKYNPAKEPRALRDVSFSIQDGERVALLGANGAGKSTLLLSLVGILPAAEGTVQVDELQLDRTNLPQIRQKIGVVFQNPDDQLFMPTVFQDIAFGPRNYGVPEAEITQRADEILDALGISALKNRMVHKLSGGEKRLAALAGVLVMRPSLLLLDEPTSFLDLNAAKRLAECLRNLKQSCLITTHDLLFVKDLCDRFLFLDRGELRWNCQRQELAGYLADEGWEN
ncbi:MAG: ABC transporter ATP-binding protein [Oscillospiraceae bacterium]|uniref:energy-coupling factor ABC transporter ATP-binding protein n=1 Tax=Oscillibacter ruminantium TaxID=1263547 RepID=UPI0002F8C19F|nr:ABC transporter ATP-binding protein [Oscillibacter ruminantium]MDD3228889.1 ABC transporter ATP-binding protein [Oscillospiraceae bacterium]